MNAFSDGHSEAPGRGGTRLNVEIKARCAQPDAIRLKLRDLGAVYEGTDRQVDTYFNVTSGRLKLRQGHLETGLIHYARGDDARPRQADVTLYDPDDVPGLKQILRKALGLRVVVAKSRDIFWLGNVKFHVDEVAGLGTFVEIEAIDRDGTIGPEHLARQCQQFMDALGIAAADLEGRSYSDLVASEQG